MEERMVEELVEMMVEMEGGRPREARRLHAAVGCRLQLEKKEKNERERKKGG